MFFCLHHWNVTSLRAGVQSVWFTFTWKAPEEIPERAAGEHWGWNDSPGSVTAMPAAGAGGGHSRMQAEWKEKGPGAEPGRDLRATLKPRARERGPQRTDEGCRGWTLYRHLYFVPQTGAPDSTCRAKMPWQWRVPAGGEAKITKCLREVSSEKDPWSGPLVAASVACGDRLQI